VKTRVVNVRNAGGDFVPVDRRTIFGNPFKIPRDGTREEVVEKYREWFMDRIAVDPGFRRAVMELRGCRLGCWCKPELCHGDVIAEWLNGEEVGVD
jgi:hypothetical protein